MFLSVSPSWAAKISRSMLRIDGSLLSLAESAHSRSGFAYWVCADVKILPPGRELFRL
jgi:hypothetical protein